MKKLTAFISALTIAAAAVPSFASAEGEVKGDVTGDGLITGADAAEILRYFSALQSGLEPSAECHYYDNIQLYGDYNGDGTIDGNDSSAIMFDIINTTDKNISDIVTECNEYIAKEYPLLGDVSGDGVVNGTDATIVLRYYSYISSYIDTANIEENTYILERGDMNGDGLIDGSDATSILKEFVSQY